MAFMGSFSINVPLIDSNILDSLIYGGSKWPKKVHRRRLPVPAVLSAAKASASFFAPVPCSHFRARPPQVSLVSAQIRTRQYFFLRQQEESSLLPCQV